MISNIIILGNGFDRSLALKTAYFQFVDFLDTLSERVIKQSNKTGESEKNSWNLADEEGYKHIINNTFSIIKSYHKDDILFEMKKFFLNFFPTPKSFEMISNNSFVNYLKFLQDKSSLYETNWNNIEKAIMEIADAVDYLISNIAEEQVRTFLFETDSDLSYFKSFPNYLAYHFIKNRLIQGSPKFVRNEFSSDLAPLLSLNKQLLQELEYLTLLLEFYLIYIERKQFEEIEPTKFTELLESIGNKKYITFNYTNTLESFINEHSENIHHVHGKVRTGEYSLTHKQNNMVFGIQDQKTENINRNVVGYQKFYQRVLKNTGSQYKEFIAEDKHGVQNFIVFGHSVDTVDEGIFKEIFSSSDFVQSSKHMRRFIFTYYTIEDKQDLIINLTTILGKELFVQLVDEEKIKLLYSEDVEAIKKNLLPEYTRQRISF